jgi:hypothetical protein
VLPGFEQYPHAPWFKPQPGSLLTLALAAVFHAGGVADDEWLSRATNWCWRSIHTNEQSGGYWLKYALAFLDAVPDEQRAPRGDRVARRPLRPLDLSPRPRSRSRDLISNAQIEAHLDTIESTQQEDGGWLFDWLAWSPAQTTDWRWNVTIRALWLRDNGRL